MEYFNKYLMYYNLLSVADLSATQSKVKQFIQSINLVPPQWNNYKNGIGLCIGLEYSTLAMFELIRSLNEINKDAGKILSLAAQKCVELKDLLELLKKENKIYDDIIAEMSKLQIQLENTPEIITEQIHKKGKDGKIISETITTKNELYYSLQNSIMTKGEELKAQDIKCTELCLQIDLIINVLKQLNVGDYSGALITAANLEGNKQNVLPQHEYPEGLIEKLRDYKIEGLDYYEDPKTGIKYYPLGRGENNRFDKKWGCTALDILAVFPDGSRNVIYSQNAGVADANGNIYVCGPCALSSLLSQFGLFLPPNSRKYGFIATTEFFNTLNGTSNNLFRYNGKSYRLECTGTGENGEVELLYAAPGEKENNNNPQLKEYIEIHQELDVSTAKVMYFKEKALETIEEGGSFAIRTSKSTSNDEKVFSFTTAGHFITVKPLRDSSGGLVYNENGEVMLTVFNSNYSNPASSSWNSKGLLRYDANNIGSDRTNDPAKADFVPMTLCKGNNPIGYHAVTVSLDQLIRDTVVNGDGMNAMFCIKDVELVEVESS